MKRTILLFLFGVLCTATALFAQGTKESDRELLVSAAASTTDCMLELVDIYSAAHPDIAIYCNFASSGSLQQQIEQGAPADMFFSASPKQMRILQEKGLMETSTVKDLLENRIVLITPKDGVMLSSFDNLLDPSLVKIGVGEPKSVPAGQYAAQVFEYFGMTEKLSSKLVFAKDVREVLSWVETGNVQAGVVYETDAKMSDGVVVRAIAPSESHTPVVYPIGVVKASKQKEAAEEFETFLFSKEAASVFAKYGFTVIDKDV